MQAVTDTVTFAIKLLIELPSKRIIEVDDREMQLFAMKQTGLRRSVCIHGTVVVQVVPGKIGKHCAGHGQVVDPPLFECV